MIVGFLVLQELLRFVPSTFEIADHQQVAPQIVEAIADQEGVDPLTLSPSLYEIIDPEALEALFASTTRVERQGQVEFPYHGHQITISADSGYTITVEEFDQSASEQNQALEIEQGD